MLDLSDLIVGLISLVIGGSGASIYIMKKYTITKKISKKKQTQIVKGNYNQQAG